MLGAISADFVKVAEKLKGSSHAIRQQGGYSHPIFPVAQVPIALGTLLIDKGAMGNQYYYYATYMDVLVRWGLMANDRAVAFQHAYKDPETYCCLLVVDRSDTSFVHVPYP